jgi:DNA-binding FrmR family transcriptional regulator
MTEVHVAPSEYEPVVNRLKRAKGQIEGILRMIEEGRDCGDVVTQIAAVSKAIDRAGFTMIAAGLHQCLVDGEDTTATRERLEKAFLSLA